MANTALTSTELPKSDAPAAANQRSGIEWLGLPLSTVLILGGLAAAIAGPWLAFWPAPAWHAGIYLDGVGFYTVAACGAVCFFQGILNFFPFFQRRRVAILTISTSIMAIPLFMFAIFPAVMAAGYAKGAGAQILPNTAGPSAPLFRVALIGDTHARSERLQIVLEQIADFHQNEPLDAVFHSGDLVDDLEPGETFQEAVERFYYKALAPLPELGVPFYLALGNHDVYAGMMEDCANYPAFHMGGRDYYARELGEGLVTAYFLNSTTFNNDPRQYLWLKETLAASQSRWNIVVLHHSLSASEIKHGTDHRRAAVFEPLLRTEPNIDLVVSGHNHFYERRKPVHGTTFLVAGIAAKPGDERPWPEDSQRAFGKLGVQGFVTLDITGQAIRIRGFDDKGSAFDDFVIEKPGVNDSGATEAREISPTG